MSTSQLIIIILSGQFLAAILGSITAFAINVISARGGRKKAAQEWYADTYITKGLDPLIAYLLSLLFDLFNTTIDNKMPLPPGKTLPIEALANLQILFGNTLPLDMIGSIHASLATGPDETDEVSLAALELSNLLFKARRTLLKKISKGVDTKGAWIDTGDRQNQINSDIVQLLYEKTKDKTHWGGRFYQFG